MEYFDTDGNMISVSVNETKPPKKKPKLDKENMATEKSLKRKEDPGTENEGNELSIQVQQFLNLADSDCSTPPNTTLKKKRQE